MLGGQEQIKPLPHRRQEISLMGVSVVPLSPLLEPQTQEQELYLGLLWGQVAEAVVVVVSSEPY